MLHLEKPLDLAQYAINETYKRQLCLNRISLAQLCSKIERETSIIPKNKEDLPMGIIMPTIFRKYGEYGIKPLPQSVVTKETPKDGIMKRKVDAVLNVYFEKRKGES
ncbi:MAG: hypothetical protein U0L73_12970 [Ruminococcus bromii]|nr:hypothetical protein [Ruminococcus bromii]